MTQYEQGFMDKCAEYGVDPEMVKQAFPQKLKQILSHPILSAVHPFKTGYAYRNSPTRSDFYTLMDFLRGERGAWRMAKKSPGDMGQILEKLFQDSGTTREAWRASDFDLPSFLTRHGQLSRYNDYKNALADMADLKAEFGQARSNPGLFESFSDRLSALSDYGARKRDLGKLIEESKKGLQAENNPFFLMGY